MIKTLQNISISGNGVNFNTKLIYSANLRPGFAEPSKLSLDLVDENGYYDDIFGTVASRTPLSLTNSYTIGFPGGLSFTGFPISATKNNSNQGKTVQVQFVDGSTVLDRIYIALKGRVQPTNGVIIIGKEVDPCEKLAEMLESPDPCDPCYKKYKEAAEDSKSDINLDNFEERKQQILKDCQDSKKITLLDVEYNFADFLAELRKFGWVKRGPANTYPKYKVRYTGTARSVINNFCADLGYTYYWDNGLVFISIANGILPSFPTSETMQANGITELSEMKTLENTKSSSVTYYYGRQGEYKEYDCSKYFGYDYLLGLTPANMQNVFKQSSRNSRNSIELQKYFIYCCLCRYSSLLADCYLWSDVYGIKNFSSLQAQQGKNLFGLGMTILGGTNTGDPNFETIKSHVPEEQREFVDNFLQKDGYFFVAKLDQGFATSYFDQGSSIGNEFIGRYFYTRTAVPDLAEINVPYGSLNEFTHSEGDEAALKNLFTRFINMQIINPNSEYIDFVNNFKKGVFRKIITLELEPAWYPNDVSTIDLTEPQKYAFINVGNADFLKDMFNKGQAFEENTFLFMCRPYDFTISMTQDAHPSFQVTKDHLGLRSDRAPKLSLKSGGKVSYEIFAPPASWDSNISHPKGFVSEITYNRNIKNVNNIQIIPLEDCITKGGNSDLRMGFDMVERDISSLDFNFLLNGKITDFTEAFDVQGTKIKYKCKLDKKDLENFLVDKMDINAYQSPTQFYSKTYTLAGIYTNGLSIGNGLQSLDISISDSGPQTTFTIGNQAAIPLNTDIVYNTLEASLNKMKIKALGGK